MDADLDPADPDHTGDADNPDRLAARDTWAVWQGVPYPCRDRTDQWPLLSLRARDDGRAPEGLDRVRGGSERRYVHLVEAERVDAWYQASWTFRWRGEPFTCHGLTDRGTVRGRYQGEDEEFAALHLHRSAGWEGDFPLDEITDVAEHRTDLRALRRERLRLLEQTRGYEPRALAVVDGRELPAAMEADASGLVAVGEPDSQRLVPVEELEAWWGVYWTYTVGGPAMGLGCHPFAALGPYQDAVKGRYIGDQTYGLVMHAYLLREERGADGRTLYTNLAYPERLTDLVEHRVDLLAD